MPFWKKNTFCCFLFVPPLLGTGFLLLGWGAQTSSEPSVSPSPPLARSPPYTKSIMEPAIDQAPNKGSPSTFAKELSAGTSHSSGFCGLIFLCVGWLVFLYPESKHWQILLQAKMGSIKYGARKEERGSLSKADCHHKLKHFGIQR